MVGEYRGKHAIIARRLVVLSPATRAFPGMAAIVHPRRRGKLPKDWLCAAGDPEPSTAMCPLTRRPAVE